MPKQTPPTPGRLGELPGSGRLLRGSRAAAPVRGEIRQRLHGGPLKAPEIAALHSPQPGLM